MAEGLQYKIGADVTDFKSAMNDAIANLQKFDAATQKAIQGVTNNFKSLSSLESQLGRFKDGLSNATDPGSFARLQRAIDATKTRIDLLNKPIETLNRGLGQLGTRSGVGGATASLNALSQVARDLPFGFIAIQNNLPILADQFGALVRTSGGLGGALKGLGAALIGPAGLAFAFGAIISGITVLTQKYGSIGGAINALLGTQTALSRTVDAGKKSYDEYTKSIVTNQQIIDQARGSSQGEIEKVNALVGVINAETSSREKKNNALIQLQKINKDYFGDLTIEDSKTGKLTDKVNEYTQALIKAAVVKGFEGKISELSQELFKQEDILQKVAASYSKVGNAGANALRAGATFGAAYQQAVAPALAAGKIEAQFKQQVENVTKLREEYKRLSDGIAKAVGEQSNFAPLSTPKAGKKDPIEVPIKVVPLATIPVDFEKELQDELDKNFIRIKGLDVPLFLNPRVSGKVKNEFDDFAALQLAKLENKLDKTKEFSDALAAQLSASFSDVFSSLGEGIGNIFAGVANGFSLGATVLTGLADVLINVGKLAISTGVAILGIKKALQTLNPAIAIAGGVALVALGSAVKGKLAKSVPKFAEGGIVTRPTAGIFGEAGPEAVMPLDKLNSMLGSFGGSNMQVSGSFALRGNDLYASIERTKKQQGRAF